MARIAIQPTAPRPPIVPKAVHAVRKPDSTRRLGMKTRKPRTCATVRRADSPKFVWAKPPETAAEIAEDAELQARATDDRYAHAAYLELANRVLRRTIGAHPGDARKGWQIQAAIVTHCDYKPGSNADPCPWGFIAAAVVRHPEAGECWFKRWAPTWREAIDLALAAAVMA